jgi:hypothetical protein
VVEVEEEEEEEEEQEEEEEKVGLAAKETTKEDGIPDETYG